MSEIPARCVQKISAPLIVFREMKSKITFENPNHNSYFAIQVDGCVFNAADGPKCDKLLESEEFADQYFVELKGGDGCLGIASVSRPDCRRGCHGIHPR